MNSSFKTEADSSEDEYEEANEELLDIECLFCEQHFASFEATFSHITADHGGLDLLDTCKASAMDSTIQYIKLVNYIRSTKVEASQVAEVIASRRFDDDAYLKPVLEDDHLLMFGKC